MGLRPVHDRMPVILFREKEGLRLHPSADDNEALIGLLTPYPAEEMEVYPVSTKVNRPSNNSPENVGPA